MLSCLHELYMNMKMEVFDLLLFLVPYIFV